MNFQEGIRQLQSFEYEKAVFRFKEAARADRTPQDRATCEAWLGLAYAKLDDMPSAEEAFRRALRSDILVSLPAGAPPKVIERFAEIRAEEKRRAYDKDDDGVPDGDDKCPDEAGDRSFQGCKAPAPATDGDGDGVLDRDDRCPVVAGVVSNQGCPVVDDGTGTKTDKPKKQKNEGDDPADEGKPVPWQAFAAGGTGIVGLAGIGGGVALSLLAQGTHAEAEKATFQDERAKLNNAMTGQQTGAVGLYAVGGVLTASAVAFGIWAMTAGE